MPRNFGSRNPPAETYIAQTSRSNYQTGTSVYTGSRSPTHPDRLREPGRPRLGVRRHRNTRRPTQIACGIPAPGHVRLTKGVTYYFMVSSLQAQGGNLQFQVTR
ncbi:MAG: hypothetical protein M3083_21230 [Actinomycetota bacterium]|nr:hypothetical protein [Actinomycetota bacterium]